MLAFVFLIAVIYVTSRVVYIKPSEQRIDQLIKQSLQYSGVNKFLYREFLANINMAKEYKAHEDISGKLLERALGNLEEIASLAGDIDSSYISEIGELIINIKQEFEILKDETLLK